MSTSMTTVTWAKSGHSAFGDTSSSMESDEKLSELYILASGLSKSSLGARVRVVRLNEILSGIHMTISSHCSRRPHVAFSDELLRVLDLSRGELRRLLCNETYDPSRFEEVTDDGGGSAGKKKKTSNQGKSSANQSGSPTDSSLSPAPHAGKQSAGGSGGGKRPPDGRKRKFLGPYAPQRKRKRNKRGKKQAKRAKRVKTVQQPNVTSSDDETTTGDDFVHALPSESETSPQEDTGNNDEDSVEEVEVLPGRKNKARKRKMVNKAVRTACVDDCECWAGGKDATIRDFKDAVTGVEQRHKIMIHQHYCHLSLFSKLQSLSDVVQELKDDTDTQRKQQKEVLEYVKALAASKKFDEQRQRDISKLRIKFNTFTQLQEALDEEPDALARTLAYCDQDDDNDGAKYLDNYLKSIMELSLLYRMFPSTDKTNRSTHSFIFAQEYFFLPEQLQEMMFHYMMDKWPHYWKVSRCKKRLRSLLEYHRKTRSYQMRNLLTARTKGANAHPLYFAVYWDWSKQTKVFTRPAPLWEEDSDATRDEYLELFLEEWEATVIEKKLQNWSHQAPDQSKEKKKERDEETESKAQRSQLAARAVPEPYWQFTD